jgi:hypothetical protein
MTNVHGVDPNSASGSFRAGAEGWSCLRLGLTGNSVDRQAKATRVTLTSERLTELSRDSYDPGVDDYFEAEGYESDGLPSLSEAATFRRYLTKALADAEASWINEWPIHDDIAFYRYPREWHRRIGYVVEGYGLDEPPPGVAPIENLERSGLLEAAGFELMP